MNEIVVAGAGVFGTSVAERLAWNRNNHVVLHTIEEDVMEDINTNHQNTKYFPTKFLNPGITATGDDSVFENADVVMLVLPSSVIVPFSERIRNHTKGTILCNRDHERVPHFLYLRRKEGGL